MKKLILVVGLALLPSLGQASVGWMIYPYGVPTKDKDEDYQRLLNCKEAEYLGFQWFARSSYDANDLQRQRAGELARAGRKLIIDLWFGNSPPFSWRYFNFPNIALDPKIRQEFFDRCTDPFLEHWGAENLYAVHLMEETGMQFGWERDVAGYADEEIGYDNGSNWDNPASFEWGRSIAGPYNLNIRKYNDLFRKETGLDMRLAPIWSAEEKSRFNEWVQQTMEGGAHVQFAKHVHQKYPGLKVYAFNSGPALIPQSKVLDGHFTDPYTNTIGVYQSLRGLRSIMRPEMDLVTMMWGNKEKPIPQRLSQQAACYIGGADILSTFGDGEATSDEYLNIVRDSVRPFLGLPRFVSRPQVLVLGGRPLFGATLQAGQFWITGFTHYDRQTLPGPLDQYKLIFSWGGATRPDVAEWVRKGGILVGVYSAGDLLEKEGLIESQHKTSRLEIEYKPDDWIRQNLWLQESYQLDLNPVAEYTVKDENVAHKDQFLYVAPYGEGLVVFMPAICYVHPPWQYEPIWEGYRQLLTDVCRGALLYRKQAAAAQTFFADPQLGNDYMKATSTDGRTVYILLNDVHGPHESQTSFVVKGRDRVTGQNDVTFGVEHPVVIIEQGG
ncbi:MAG: hypothetical protein GX100_00575 [candidate division WS1 bacterium]|nr:hypothetical protein [candidate division WS1 bacterium]